LLSSFCSKMVWFCEVHWLINLTQFRSSGPSRELGTEQILNKYLFSEWIHSACVYWCQPSGDVGTSKWWILDFSSEWRMSFSKKVTRMIWNNSNTVRVHWCRPIEGACIAISESLWVTCYFQITPVMSLGLFIYHPSVHSSNHSTLA
jgi:hypothetical protein